MPDYTSEASVPVAAQPRLNKTDQLARYRQRVELCRKFRQTEGLDETWKRCIDLYRGKHFTNDLPYKDRIAVNIAFSTINTIGPSVAVNYPKIAVSARKQQDADRAQITEALINYWWRHFDFKPEFQRCVKDSLVVGHGWLKVGYRFEEVPEDIPRDEQAKMHAHLSQQAQQYADQNPDLAGDLPSDHDIFASLPTQRMAVKEDHPFVERVSPFNIYVDPQATCLEDMQWIAQKVVRNYEDVIRDPRFNSKARKAVQPDSFVNFRDSDPNPPKKGNLSDDVKRVTIWEFYDLQRETLCIFSDKGDGYLVDPMALPYAYGMPFVMLRCYEVPDQFYPMGELEQLEPLQNELNLTRTQMVNVRKKFARKYAYRRSMLSEQGVNALASEVDNTLVPIEDDSVPLEDVVRPIQQIPVDPQMYTLSETIEADMDRVSGVNEYMRGNPDPIRRTATEAGLIQDAANARSSDKLAQVEDCIRRVAQRLIQLAQQYMTSEQAVRVVGTYGKAWVTVNPEDIEGEYDFEVEAGSTQPVNDTFRRQQALDMLNALGPFMGRILDIQQVLTHVLRYGFNVTDPEKLFVKGPVPPIPTERILETINYKDAPPDVQRQMEAHAGLQPSQIPPDLVPEAEQLASQQDGATPQQAAVLADQQGPAPVNHLLPPPADHSRY